MGLITPLLLSAICLISGIRGSDYDDDEEPDFTFRTYYHDGPPAVLIVIIIVVVLLIKAAIICCCCLCCPASPIYRWCHRNNSTTVTIIQPTAPSYPGNVGQHNFNFGQPPQPAMVNDPPPQYNRDGYTKFVTPSGLESGHNQ